MRVGGLHRLTDVYEVDPPLMPQHVEGTEVRVHQMTPGEHPLHALQTYIRRCGHGNRCTSYRNVHVHVEWTWCTAYRIVHGHYVQPA